MTCWPNIRCHDNVNPFRKSLSLSRSLFFAALVMAILMPASGQGKGATVEAKSAELADVKSAIASASEGDTVTVPAGTATWTSTLVITKGVTLQGATSISGSLSNPLVSDKTIILDDVPRQGHRHPSPTGQQNSPRRSGSSLSGTRPLRGQTRAASGPNAAAGPPMGRTPAIVRATLKPNQSFRLTGFTFKYGSVTSFAQNGGVHLVGTCPSARIDHCHFDQLYANPFIMTRGQIYGVVDHCVFDERGGHLPFRFTTMDGEDTLMATDPGQMQRTLEARSSCLSRTTPSVTLMGTKVMVLIRMAAAATLHATIIWLTPR